MNKRIFLERVKTRMAELGIASERALGLKAGVSVDLLRMLRNGRTRSPSVENMQKFADALECPLAWLIGDQDGWVSVMTSGPGQGLSEPVDVVGQVQAGTWVEAIEWDAAERTTMLLPRDSRFHGLKRYGFKVLGSSMDKLFPHGSTVLAVKLSDLGKMPPNKAAVIVHVKRQDLWEATCKIYVERPDGSVWLEPRSTEAKYRPIPLPAAGKRDPRPKAGEPDSIEVFALVTGVYMEH
jgi:repressor LexA